MSSTTDTGERSSAEIEREVENTRRGLTGTLEELRERASPGQLIEQVVDYVRSSGGGDMMRNVGRSVRENPMPLLLIGAGIGWMLMSGGQDHGGRSERHAYRRGRHAHRDWREGQSSGGGVGGTLGQARERVGEMASGVGETVSDAARRVGDFAGGIGESVQGAAGQVGEMASSAYRRVTDAAGATLERAPVSRDDARRGLDWMLREQPLLIGVMGLAMGAALGAVLPGTETEDALMGETRDEVATQARALAEAGYEGLREEAGERAGDAAEGAEGLAGSVRHAAHEARSATRDAAHEMAEQAKSALGAKTGERGEGRSTPDPMRT